MGFNDKAYTKDSHEIYFEEGKDYFFEFGIVFDVGVEPCLY